MARSIRRRLALHLALLVAVSVVLRVAVIPAEACPPIDASGVLASIDETVSWFERGMRSDGRFTYGYDKEHDAVDPAYNQARHAGVVMSLYQTYRLLGWERALALADAGTAYALDGLVFHDDWSAWQNSGDIAVGANALLAAALAQRRLATGDPVHDDTLRGIGRFLLAQQQPDGSVHAFWRPATGESIPVTTIFTTGQASWVWALLGRFFPDEGWSDAAARTLDYLATERDRAEGEIARYPDHWAAYTLGDLEPEARSDLHLDYARRLAGYFGTRLRFESQRTGEGINLYVRWYPGPPAGVGTAMEGIGALHRLSVDDPRLADLRLAIEDRLICAAGLMAERQETAATASAKARPELVRGAWFYRGHTQMDDQQHILSGLIDALSILQAREEEAAR